MKLSTPLGNCVQLHVLIKALATLNLIEIWCSCLCMNLKKKIRMKKVIFGNHCSSYQQKSLSYQTWNQGVSAVICADLEGKGLENSNLFNSNSKITEIENNINEITKLPRKFKLIKFTW